MKNIDLNEYIEKVKKDLELSLERKSNAFEISNSYLKRNEFPKNRSILALDMGGTNFRIAKVTFDNEGIPTISNIKKLPMPGAKGREKITFDDFINTLSNEISKYDEIDVGITFSYPCEILDNKDGRILCFSKQVNISNAEGKILGEEINKVIDIKRNFVILNDTVSCLLGTNNANMSLILGTGLNICFKNKDGYIINTECGRYKGFPTEHFDFGELTEMKVSGAYINDLININPILKDELFDRASKLVATEIIAIAKYMAEDINLAIEGAVYYNVEPIRNGIKKYLDLSGIKYTLLDGRDKVLIGTAVAISS